MPRQRSKKVNGDRKSEPKPAAKFDVGSEPNDSENEDLGMSDIDEEEAELTRLLLGGDAGFNTFAGKDEEDGSENATGEEEEGEPQAGIEDLADEEVRNISLVHKVLQLTNI